MTHSENSSTQGFKSMRQNHTSAFAKALALLAAAVAVILLASGCSTDPVETTDEYVNTAEARNSVTFAVDDLGRKTVTGKDAPEAREGKYVGIFYFLWLLAV